MIVIVDKLKWNERKQYNNMKCDVQIEIALLVTIVIDECSF